MAGWIFRRGFRNQDNKHHELGRRRRETRRPVSGCGTSRDRLPARHRCDKMRDTSDLEMPDVAPRALTRTSTLRDGSPCTRASITTANNARSIRRRRPHQRRQERPLTQLGDMRHLRFVAASPAVGRRLLVPLVVAGQRPAAERAVDHRFQAVAFACGQEVFFDGADVLVRRVDVSEIFLTRRR